MSDFLTEAVDAPDTCHLFLDEAGVPDIFDEIHDLHHGGPGGIYFVRNRPLTIESRFPSREEKKKRPRI